VCTKDDAPDPRVVGCTGAHHARLERDIEGALVQRFSVEKLRG
jgi:hypothetical protein